MKLEITQITETIQKAIERMSNDRRPESIEDHQLWALTRNAMPDHVQSSEALQALALLF